jgi:uncharacterized LabA/DUF88 family protein
VPNGLIKVITYIDGFNLYHGICDKGWRRYLWLDIYALSNNLLQFNQELVKVKYFTADITHNPSKQVRQSTYLDALSTLSFVEIIKGKFLEVPFECHLCNKNGFIHKEKMTDVNIAIEMLLDAQRNNFDTAILVSADTDLVPVVKYVVQTLDKRVTVAFPPERWSDHLKDTTHRHYKIGRDKLAKSQLPLKIKISSKLTLERPPEWV